MAVNYFKTWSSRPSQYEVPVIETARLAREMNAREAAAESQIDGVLNIGHKINVWQQAKWHRSWEKSSVRFIVFDDCRRYDSCDFRVGADVRDSRKTSPAIASVKPYTPLELAGRDIYIAEGCCNCHSQQIRPLVADKERYGDYSQAGEFIYGPSTIVGFASRWGLTWLARAASNRMFGTTIICENQRK